MRLGLFLLLALRLYAQPAEGTDFIDMGGDVIPSYENTSGGLVLSYTTQYSWSITKDPNGNKVFTFSAKQCTYFSSLQLFPGNYIWVALPAPVCGPLSQSQALTLGPISAALTEFNNYHPNAPHLPPVYQPSLEPGSPVASLSKAVSPKLTAVQPVTQPNPRMIFLDGLGNTAIAFDLTTNTIVSQVAVPSTTGPLGIRPVSTGQQNEIWVANGGLEVTVVDLAGQKVVTNILTPSIPRASTVAGIAFTNDGGTAFEAVGFSSPDSSGNNGALLVFDAVNRVVTSTFLLKNAPVAMVIAPDSSTVYLLTNSGLLTYYDVLSGTADLSLSTYTPGMAGGYPGFGAQVFIHPDGTRLFWNVNYLLVVFDLTTHKIASVVNTGLPSTSATTMQMSQDGSTLWLANAPGMVAAYDTRSAVVLATFTTSPGSTVYPGPADWK
jgi:hypothetical protein